MNKGCSDLFASFILKAIALTPNRDHTYLINKYLANINDENVRYEISEVIKDLIESR